jgi:hypothetical protein
MDSRSTIVQNLIDITDSDNNKIKIDEIRIDFSCNKYSSKKNSIYRIVLNDKFLTKRDRYNFKYKCVTCNSIHVVGTTQFLRKINKCSIRCNLCCNKDDAKCENNDLQPSFLEMRVASEKLFEEYDEDFKANYFNYHLTWRRLFKNITEYSEYSKWKVFH